MLKLILPLAGLIVILVLVFAFLNTGRNSYHEMTGPELMDSFASFARKNKDFDHYKLFVGQKKVTWEQGPSLAGFLQGLDGGEFVDSVSLSYQIPVFINLVGDWAINIKDSMVDVQAPMPTFGEALLDPASLKIQFKGQVSSEQQSTLQEMLKENLSSYRVALDNNSRQALEIESRRHLEDLVSKWLHETYSQVPDFKYQISFNGSKDAGGPDEP